MRIKNEYDQTIYWRTFKPDETVYGIGLKQGQVERGKTDEWRDDSWRTVKLEVKLGDIIFSSKVLASAGRIFNMTDDLILTKDGRLEVAQVKLSLSGTFDHSTRTEIRFVDRRGHTGDFTQTVTSKLSATTTDSETNESISSHEQTWTAGGQLGGTLGKEDSSHASAQLSAQFEDKVLNSLRSSYETSLSQMWEKTTEDAITFEGGEIHAVKSVWALKSERGTAEYFGERTEFSVLKSADSSAIKTSAYESPEKMPPEYLQKWQLLFGKD
jgi:hypothetical protein